MFIAENTQTDSTPERWKIIRKRVRWAAERVERLSIRFRGHEYLSPLGLQTLGKRKRRI